MVTRLQYSDWEKFIAQNRDKLVVIGHYTSINNNVCIIVKLDKCYYEHWCSNRDRLEYLDFIKKYTFNESIIKVSDFLNNVQFSKFKKPQSFNSIFNFTTRLKHPETIYTANNTLHLTRYQQKAIYLINKHFDLNPPHFENVQQVNTYFEKYYDLLNIK